MARYVNDGWGGQENAVVKKIIHGNSPHLCLFAKSTISVREEITYDYGDKDADWRSKVGFYLAKFLNLYLNN